LDVGKKDKSKMKKQHGEVMVDHRASPGLPEDVARWAGYDPKLCGEGKLFESATLTCSHCKNSMIKNPFRVREREHCAKCGYHYICDFCYADMQKPDYSHLPFERLVDEALNLAEKGIILGSPQELLSPAQIIKP
jgi:hypothetical protein